MAAAPDRNSTGDLLPDFCNTHRIVEVLLVCEAVAVVLALVAAHDTIAFVQRLLLLTLYVQWIGILSAAALCLVRRHVGGRVSRPAMLAVCYVVLLLVTWLVAELAHGIGRYTWMMPLADPAERLVFVLRSVGVCAVVSALALRYFWLRASWREGIRAEAWVRLDALQARIRPHFLFNSLNSIASLIGTRPDDAERATEDLATLLRARLRADGPALVPLAAELELVEAYLHIEQFRFGERLTLAWDIDAASRSYLVPALSLQPLVENAIVHGIARRAEGGELAISAKMNGGQLWIRISNPVGQRQAGASRGPQGNRQALRNIEQRLALHFDHEARLLTLENNDRFVVDLIMPGRLR